MFNKLDDIVAAVKQQGRKRLIVACGQDAHTVESVAEAVRMGLVEAALVGDRAEIERVCKAESIDAGMFRIVEAASDTESVDRAVRMVAAGEGDALMKGLVSTDKYMRGILNREYSLVPPKGVLNHLLVLQLPGYGRLLVVADVAVLTYPDIAQKTSMVRQLIAVARKLGVETPKVAMIAPTEQMSTTLPACMDAAVISKMCDRGDFGDAIVEGPLAIDVALYPDAVAVKKLRGSRVAGEADALCFANIDAGNSFFKCTTAIAGGLHAGMVVGARVPCILTSRSDPKESKLYSIALAAL
ncbi:MAG: phosphate butyryltransferase [Rikenellaceae bacterium]|jgi:phosphate butyryltransferase|nr:phosphate butyryltransferase [Rikenellaceae bacterium]